MFQTPAERGGSPKSLTPSILHLSRLSSINPPATREPLMARVHTPRDNDTTLSFCCHDTSRWFIAIIASR